MSTEILKPHALSLGDTIGVVAPSYPFPSDLNSDYYRQYLSGKQELEAMGFKVKEGNNLGKVHWWSGGTPKERAEDINNFFADKNVAAIIANDGANDSIRVLQYLDYELIRSNPKPFIGFSNITNIHCALNVKTGLIGFHMGLLSYELGKFWQEAPEKIRGFGRNYFKSVLTSSEPLGKIEPLTDWECWREGEATGKLFGGNLSMMDSLIGTPYFPSVDDLSGSILFWEIDNSPTYRIERILTHLKYAGILDVISGMVVGKLVDMKPTTQFFPEPTYKEIVLECLEGYSFPILADVDFGHRMVQIPMPIGVEATINATSRELFLNESAVA